MAVDTLGLASVSCLRAFSTHDVLDAVDDLHVRRIDAVTNATEVVDREAVRDGPDEVFIRFAVHTQMAGWNAQTCISSTAREACPEPASIRRNGAAL